MRAFKAEISMHKDFHTYSYRIFLKEDEAGKWCQEQSQRDSEITGQIFYTNIDTIEAKKCASCKELIEEDEGVYCERCNTLRQEI